MREFDYEVCDVFAAKALEGNQLAVFVDAGSLSGDEMQAIAREMNLSETTFVERRPRDVEQARGIRVRIFTTREELPFAGHPTLGTSSTIRRVFAELKGAEKIVLDLNAGQIAVTFAAERQSEGRAMYGEMRQLDPVFGSTHDAREIAPLLGLREEDMGSTAPQTVSTGINYCVTVLRSIEALGRFRLDVAASARYLSGRGARFFYVLAPDGQGAWRARMQFYGGEDPATGSAAGCAISYLVRHGLWPSGERLHLRQGIEIKRPSDLFLSAKLDGEKVSEVRVAGSTVPVATGRFFLA